MSKRSYDIIDLSKFLLSLVIAAIHINPFGNYGDYRFPWARIAVPVFFIISGFFLWSKLTAENANPSATVRRFVIRNIKLYAAWFILLLPINLLNQHWFAKGFFSGIGQIILRIVLGSTFPASWYLSALVVGVMVVYGLSKILSNKALFVLSGCIYGVCCLVNSYGRLFSETNILSY